MNTGAFNSTRLYPSVFRVADRFTFENKHGRVVLEALGDPRPIREIFLKDLPEDCRLTFDAIEKIALITDQQRLQVIPGRSVVTRCCGVIRHATQSTAAFCKVIELTYITKTAARDQIQRDMAEGRNALLEAIRKPIQLTK